MVAARDRGLWSAHGHRDRRRRRRRTRSSPRPRGARRRPGPADLVAPDPDFAYKPLAIAEPFGLGRAAARPARPLRRRRRCGADRRRASRTSTTPPACSASPAADGALRPAPARDRRPAGRRRHRRDHMVARRRSGGLRRPAARSRGGLRQRLAIVVPARRVWPLPAYELALMTAGEAAGMGHDDVEVIVVTPGARAALALRRGRQRRHGEELARAGVRCAPASWPRDRRQALVLRPAASASSAHALFASRACSARGSTAFRPTTRASSARRRHGQGLRRAPGPPVMASAPRSSSAASPPIRPAGRAAIARRLGVVVPDPGEPVLHGRLLTGDRSRRLRGRGDGEAAPLWWPAGKVAGLYLPRFLAEHGLAPHGALARPRAASRSTARSPRCAGSRRAGSASSPGSAERRSVHDQLVVERVADELRARRAAASSAGCARGATPPCAR